LRAIAFALVQPCPHTRVRTPSSGVCERKW